MCVLLLCDSASSLHSPHNESQNAVSVPAVRTPTTRAQTDAASDAKAAKWTREGVNSLLTTNTDPALTRALRGTYVNSGCR